MKTYINNCSKIILATFLLTVIGCSSSKDTKIEPNSKSRISTENGVYCSVSQPLSELSWLKKIVVNFSSDSTSKSAEIYKATYNGNKGFLISYCIECTSGSISEFKDCQGNTVCILGGVVGSTCIDFEKNATIAEKIWSNK